MSARGSHRIEAALRAAAASGRPALAAFLTADYPDPERFQRDLRAVAEVADVVEIGVPFSDPMADGLTIQRASRTALAGGTSVAGILDGLTWLEPRPSAPVLLMSYLNPLLAFGLDPLSRRAAACGVDGLIIPDLPLEECGPVDRALAARGLALVQLVTPVTPEPRLRRLCEASRGFVYAVSTTGITGGETAEQSQLQRYLDRVRAVSPLPVLAGFGIRHASQVEALAGHADGVVVGSALIEIIEQGGDPAAFLQGLLPGASHFVQGASPFTTEGEARPCRTP